MSSRSRIPRYRKHIAVVLCSFLAVLSWTWAKTFRGIGRDRSGIINESNIKAISVALENYASEHGGKYPATLEGLFAPGSGQLGFLKIDKPPTDPWGRSYQYLPPRAVPIVFTLGRDGVVGGSDTDQDFSSHPMIGEPGGARD